MTTINLVNPAYCYDREEAKFKCPFCKASCWFATAFFLSLHLTKHHGVQFPRECQHCGVGAFNAIWFEKHQIRCCCRQQQKVGSDDSNENLVGQVLKPSGMLKLTGDKTGLNLNKNKPAAFLWDEVADPPPGNKKIPCPICPATFKAKSGLASHMRAHKRNQERASSPGQRQPGILQDPMERLHRERLREEGLKKQFNLIKECRVLVPRLSIDSLFGSATVVDSAAVTSSDPESAGIVSMVEEMQQQSQTVQVKEESLHERLKVQFGLKECRVRLRRFDVSSTCMRAAADEPRRWPEASAAAAAPAWQSATDSAALLDRAAPAVLTSRRHEEERDGNRWDCHGEQRVRYGEKDAWRWTDEHNKAIIHSPSHNIHRRRQQQGGNLNEPVVVRSSFRFLAGFCAVVAFLVFFIHLLTWFGL